MHRDLCAGVLASGYVKRTERDEQAAQAPQDILVPLEQPGSRSFWLHIGCWSSQSVRTLDSAPLLPKWAVAATELQLCILHLLNVRGHPGEKVEELIIVDGIRISKLLSKFIYAPE